MEAEKNLTNVEISSICLSDPRTRGCYPFDNDIWINAGFVWCLLNAVVGSVGNLLTIVAIPTAKYRKKCGFNRSLDATTIFLVNLALADFLYAGVNLPLYASTFWFRGWVFGRTSCSVWAVFRFWNAFSDWFSIGLVALTRCISVVNPELSRRLFHGRRGVLWAFSIWLFSALAIGCILTASRNVTVGYDAHHGKCEFIATDDERDIFNQAFRGLHDMAMGLPCAIIVISCAVILFVTKKVSRSVQRLSSTDDPLTRSRRKKRNTRVTVTVLLVCGLYVLCTVPVTMIKNLNDNPYIYLSAFFVYWLQYSANFAIYAARSRSYRRAYLGLLTGSIWRKTATNLSDYANK